MYSSIFVLLLLSRDTSWSFRARGIFWGHTKQGDTQKQRNAYRVAVLTRCLPTIICASYLCYHTTTLYAIRNS